MNHLLYWFTLSSNPDTERRLSSSALMGEIEDAFGSYDAFVAAFNSSALSLFGSGYVWLVRNQNAGMHLSVHTSCVNVSAIECVRAFSPAARARDRRDREPGAHVREERVPGAGWTVLHPAAHDRRVGARLLS